MSLHIVCPIKCSKTEALASGTDGSGLQWSLPHFYSPITLSLHIGLIFSCRGETYSEFPPHHILPVCGNQQWTHQFQQNWNTDQQSLAPSRVPAHSCVNQSRVHTVVHSNWPVLSPVCIPSCEWEGQSRLGLGEKPRQPQTGFGPFICLKRLKFLYFCLPLKINSAIIMPLLKC